MRSYSSLSMVYDRLIDVDYKAQADYLLSLFAKHGGKCSSLLDLACGTGSLTWELACRGCEMVAVDGSGEMLALAAEKSCDAEREPLWLCQDMRELDLYGTVEGAVCTLDGFSHLRKTEDIAEVLRRLSLFIEPKGLLIFDVNTPYKHREILGDNTFVFEDEGIYCTWRNTYRPKTSEVSMLLDIFVEDENGAYERFDDEISERAYSEKTWQKLLKEAQFTPLAIYGDMSVDAPAADEQRWVIVARNDTTNYD